MHLALDEETEALRESVRQFVKSRVRPKGRDWDEAGAIPEEALNDGWALSILAAGLPESAGGFAAAGSKPSALTHAVALEEIAWGDLSYAARLYEPFLAAIPIALHGADAQKKELLPSFCGQKRPSFSGAWVEPSRAFDLASIATVAKPAFAGATLSGTKCFVGTGTKAMVFARSSASGWDGVDAFLADLPAATPEDPIGLRAAKLSRVAFDGTPATPIGPIDYRALSARALIGSAAAAVGVARAACEYAAGYAKERVAFGRPIAQYQSIAFMIADAATDVEAARLMTWKAATKIDKGEDAMKEAGLAFRFATDSAFRIADHGVQILGGHGVIRDHLSELFFRNARTLAAIPGAFLV